MRSQNSIQPSNPKLIETILGASVQLHLARLHNLLVKAGFRPNQPRVPSGSPDGGQWVDEDGNTDLVLVDGDPDELTNVPEEPPPTTKERNRWAVRVARHILQSSIEVQIHGISRWLWDHARDRIIAYQDEPKYLDQLRRAVAESKLGYDVHHVVEQTPARRDGFSEEQIEGWRDLVRIPTYRHWQITGWYGTPNRDFDDLSPRDLPTRQTLGGQNGGRPLCSTVVRSAEMRKIAAMTSDALVALYAEIGVAQAEAIDFFDTARINRLYDRKITVENELRSRPGDQRKLLFSLYNYPNRQVRLNAVQATYILNRSAAHAVLEEIAASRCLPQSANASLSLLRIAEGNSALLDDPWIPATRKERLELHRARMAQRSR